MKNNIKNVFIYTVLALSTIGVAYAWSNGPGVGYSTDPNHPNIGTHDLILNSAIDMLPADMKSQIDISAADYGSEMPNYNETICNCTYGIGDRGKHHVYYKSDGTVQDTIGADRAKDEYDLAKTNLSNGDKYNFSVHIGIMSHYIADVADYGHTMINESSGSNVEFEHYVNINPDQFFKDTYIRFDGVYDNITAYDAALALAKDTTFDNKFGNGTYTNIWMDNAMNSSSGPSYAFIDMNFTNRTHQSLNYSVNLLADVIYKMILSNITPEVTPTPTPTPVTPTPTPTPTPIPTQVVYYSSGGSSISGGSTGGGGGMPSPEPYSNIFKYESREVFMGLNPVTIRYTTPDIAIYEIIITGNDSSGVTLRVEVLKNTSKLVNGPAPAIVYKNINIWANSKRIRNATIKYKVENSWMDNNSVSSADIRMFRWNNDSKEWIELRTYTTGKDTIYTYFVSETDIISGSFAISGVKEESIIVNAGLSTAVTTSTEDIKKIEDKPINVQKAPGFEIMLLMISIIMAYIFRRKNR